MVVLILVVIVADKLKAHQATASGEYVLTSSSSAKVIFMSDGSAIGIRDMK